MALYIHCLGADGEGWMFARGGTTGTERTYVVERELAQIIWEGS